MNDLARVDQQNKYNKRSELNIDVVALHERKMNEMDENDITVELSSHTKSKKYFDIEAYKCKNVFKSGEIPLSYSIPKDVESNENDPLYIEQPNSLLDEILKATSQKKKKLLNKRQSKHQRHDDRPYIPRNRYDDNPNKLYLRNQNRHKYSDYDHTRTKSDPKRYIKVKDRRQHDQEQIYFYDDARRNDYDHHYQRQKNYFYYNKRYYDQDLYESIDKRQKSLPAPDKICAHDVAIKGYRRKRDNQLNSFETSNLKERHEDNMDTIVKEELFIKNFPRNENERTTKIHDEMNNICFDITDFENSRGIIRESMKSEDIPDNFHEDYVFEEEFDTQNFNHQNEKITGEFKDSVNQRGETNFENTINLNYPCISILKELNISIDNIMLFPDEVKKLILNSTSKEAILDILGGHT